MQKVERFEAVYQEQEHVNVLIIDKRLWVCVNGVSVIRIKTNGKLTLDPNGDYDANSSS